MKKKLKYIYVGSTSISWPASQKVNYVLVKTAVWQSYIENAFILS